MVVQDKEDGLDLLSKLVRLEAMSRQNKLVGCFLCNRLHEKRANGLVIFDDKNSPRLLLLLLLSHPHCSSFFSGGLCFFHVRYPPLVSHKDAEEKKCYNEAMLEQIDDYLDSYAPELQAIICTLREIARKSMPESKPRQGWFTNPGNDADRHPFTS